MDHYLLRCQCKYWTTIGEQLFFARDGDSVRLKALSTCTVRMQINFTPVILGVGLKPTRKNAFATLYMHSRLLRLRSLAFHMYNGRVATSLTLGLSALLNMDSYYHK